MSDLTSPSGARNDAQPGPILPDPILPGLILPGLILIGGDGGYSGVPTHIAQITRALHGKAQITVISDCNRGGYDFVASRDARHQEVAGLRSGLNPHTALRAARGLAEALRCEPDGLIWAHARMAVLLVRVLQLSGALPRHRRVVVTYHGLAFDPGHRSALAWLSRHIERLALRHGPPQDLIFLSEAARDRFRAAIGTSACARHRLSVLMNCSDLGPLPPAPPRQGGEQGQQQLRQLVMTGRAGYQKNIEAAARLFNHLPDTYQLILCGSGTDSPRLRARLARCLDASAFARVRFEGPVGDVRGLLASADGYLMSSRYEGMPIGALEAFEAGLPLALSDIPGTQEIRDAHPLTLALQFHDLPTEARALDAMITRYLAQRAATTAQIQACWEARFSYPVWEAGLNRLWQRLRRPLPD